MLGKLVPGESLMTVELPLQIECFPTAFINLAFPGEDATLLTSTAWKILAKYQRRHVISTQAVCFVTLQLGKGNFPAFCFWSIKIYCAPFLVVTQSF